MVKNEPNFKTLEITKCAKVLKMSIIVKVPQNDQNLKMGCSGPNGQNFKMGQIRVLYLYSC